MIDTDRLSRDLNELGVDDDAVQRLIHFDANAALHVRRRHRSSIAAGAVLAGCVAAGLTSLDLGFSRNTGTGDLPTLGPVASSPAPVTLRIATDGGLQVQVSVGDAVTLLPAGHAQQPQSPISVALRAEARSRSPMTGTYRVFFARVSEPANTRLHSVWVLLESATPAANESTGPSPISAGRAAAELPTQPDTFQGAVTVRLIDGSHIVKTETGILRSQ